MLFYRFKLFMSGAHSSARRESWLALSLAHRFKTDEFAGFALLAHPFGRWAEAHVDAFDVLSLVVILFVHCADASDRGAKRTEVAQANAYAVGQAVHQFKLEGIEEAFYVGRGHRRALFEQTQEVATLDGLHAGQLGVKLFFISFARIRAAH